MGFHRSDVDIIDGTLKSRSLKLSTKIPRTRADVDGSNPMSGGGNRNPTQTKHSVHPVGVSQKQAARRKIPPTQNVAKARKPDQGFTQDPRSKTGGSSSGESPSRAKKDKIPARMNSIPKAKQYRHKVGRNRD